MDYPRQVPLLYYDSSAKKCPIFFRGAADAESPHGPAVSCIYEYRVIYQIYARLDINDRNQQVAFVRAVVQNTLKTLFLLVFLFNNAHHSENIKGPTP
jgi:hypothetical protein